MTALLIVGVVVAALAALDYAALRWGVDSRNGFGDNRATPGALTR